MKPEEQAEFIEQFNTVERLLLNTMLAYIQ